MPLLSRNNTESSNTPDNSCHLRRPHPPNPLQNRPAWFSRSKKKLFRRFGKENPNTASTSASNGIASIGDDETAKKSVEDAFVHYNKPEISSPTSTVVNTTTITTTNTVGKSIEVSLQPQEEQGSELLAHVSEKLRSYEEDSFGVSSITESNLAVDQIVEVDDDKFSSDLHSSLLKLPYYEQDGFGFRLGMIGLSQTPSRDETIDELRSELYSETLDRLRSFVEERIPEAEEMVSWAVINVLNNDNDDSHNASSELSLGDHFDASQFEVDMVRKAYELKVGRTNNRNYQEEVEDNDNGLDFLQTIVNSVVFRCIQGDLSAKEAGRILVSTSIVLGATVDSPLDNDTLIFNKMDKNITTDKLRKVLGKYGEVASVTVSENGGFGICRFVTNSTVDTIINSDAKAEVVSSLGSNAVISAHALQPKQHQQVKFDII